MNLIVSEWAILTFIWADLPKLCDRYVNFISCIRKRKWDERTDDSSFSSCVLRSCPYPLVDPRVFIIPFKLPTQKTCLWESLACLNCPLTQLTEGPCVATLQCNFTHHDIQLPQRTLSEAEWAFIFAKHVFRQGSSEGRIIRLSWFLVHLLKVQRHNGRSVLFCLWAGSRNGIITESISL